MAHFGQGIIDSASVRSLTRCYQACGSHFIHTICYRYASVLFVLSNGVAYMFVSVCIMVCVVVVVVVAAAAAVV